MEKWTPEQWLTSTQAELYEGTEDITSPAAHALLVQAGVLPLSHLHSPPPNISASSPQHQSFHKELRILDNGCGLGQLTEVLLTDPSSKGKEVSIVCGDVDESLLDAVRKKGKKNGWEAVEVKRIDTHVRFTSPFSPHS